MSRGVAAAAGRIDWAVVGLVLALGAMSVLNLYSTSMATGTAIYLRHLYWLLLGIGVMTIVAIIDYRDLQRFAPVFYGGVVFALMLVLVIGKEVNGSKRWIDLGFVGFQPSELAKLAVILTLASWFQRVPRPGGYTLRDLIPVGLLLGVPMFLILQEPDLGHTLMLLFIGGSMLSYERFERRALITVVVFAVIAAPLAWKFVLHDYQKDRILTLVDGQSDALGTGWHARQARVAVGSGGLLGKGMQDGTQVAGGFSCPRTTPTSSSPTSPKSTASSAPAPCSCSTSSSSSPRSAAPPWPATSSAATSPSASARSSSGTSR
ncbi:MAG: FtsW/RodA/SpoVE family cell cycle protein [Myxococcales bacterium]|nr:FtsW/RodA/SpoVE family cell cycle protein [Myxococcales bacterium]